MKCLNGKLQVDVVVLTCGNFVGLERTLKSIAEQTFLPEMIIVSDDGSNNMFPLELLRKYPEFVFRKNEKNLGTVAHMNTAATLTRSTYIKFLASGDAFSDSAALAALMAFAQSMGTVAVTSQALICDETLQHQRYRFPGNRRGRLFNCDATTQFQALSKKNLISAVGTLLSRAFFVDFGGFDEEYFLLEDWPAWLRLTRENHLIPLLNRVTCLYGVGGVSSENIDAFGAPALHKDMIHCYEKEILPYWERFDKRTALYIQYGYDQLQGLPPKELLKKYGRLEYITRLKRRMKRCLFNQ